MRYNSTSFKKCGGIKIPKNDRIKGKDSDLHIYVQFLYDPQQEYLANAGWCQFLDILGPTHGDVNFNLSSLQGKKWDDPIEFNNLIEIVIHEITHILGFSYTDIPRWVTTDKTPHIKPTFKKNLRGIDTLFLRTPKVLEFARQYFNCPTLDGMPLENIGDDGSVGSHWKSTVIENEYMNASVSNTQAYYSGFTANLLRDTGFYDEINESMVEKIFYGQGVGCQHITGQCDSNRREYCEPEIDDQLCDYYHLGASECSKAQQENVINMNVNLTDNK
ncbi:leishmanolysin family protein, putative [Ichthyophthirius multifiliis]|uniref:Leishmanolysin family protein, putative n=1 Tax=Ichthyophthirius multifiliis TaxID=5932 RepID=G0QR48_ICHMU|nr:leishmanolysin family protein, putative [Ichthyophthirius multifiliis]EGR32308.1 leishmanolysin family protein, putative [Ichthyophthirius multifiliis]|eukprot:XP_004035794.1 leishmanolysin family protein, putative [Ichthyophthirius multifiliis]